MRTEKQQELEQHISYGTLGLEETEEVTVTKTLTGSRNGRRGTIQLSIAVSHVTCGQKLQDLVYSWPFPPFLCHSNRHVTL